MKPPSRLWRIGWPRRWRPYSLESAVEPIFHLDSYGYRPGGPR